ncbi:phosphotransferase enzyme family protein [Sunxiuqinia sp. A32]|uniref:phosphotransferase enzyme family protein n=1 Tax=Sunxiuqinia sp. A32 TaxID=3461496 RepID=UPI0040465ADD
MSGNELRNIISQFDCPGEISKIIPIGSGHIHDTYQLKNSNLQFDDYLLQKINTSIFKDVEMLMNNIHLVTQHLKRKYEMAGEESQDKVLTIVPTKGGDYYYKREGGSCWRMFVFITRTKTLDIVESEEQAYEGGKAFGQFQLLLSDLKASLLQEVLPNFHNIRFRYHQFYEAIEQDSVGRVVDVADEITFAKTREERMNIILNMGEKGLISKRITHNDTKFNNVLLDANNKAKCVIDLDTVMPGYLAYDFGDAIRTTVNTAAEDEPDLDKIQVDMKLFESFSRGFISELGKDMSKAEVVSLAHGCLLLPFIMGLRFLTDYINGDHYYKIHFPQHNLQRARAQFCLVERMESNFELINEIIQKIYLETISSK